MVNLNSKNVLLFTFLIIILFLASALISSLFLIEKMGNNECKTLPAESSVNLEGILEAGTVGEIKNDESQNDPLPPVIFNTSGIIAEIKSDRIIVAGNGSNFKDKAPREISVVFTNNTAVFVFRDQKIKYMGAEGLQNLKIGNKILMGGEENIRGKTEFIARTINVLQ